MFDLDQRIFAWRDEMKRAGITDANVLDELASHLREQTKQYVAGMDAESAFALAVERLGEPAAMRREFAKQQRGTSIPVIITASVWVAMNTAMTIAILRHGVAFLHSDIAISHNYSGFLAVNFISATAGTSAVYASGILAMFYVWKRWRGKFSEPRGNALIGAIGIFNGLIAALTAVTILCGMLWIRQETGTFFPEHLPAFMGTWTAATASLIMLLWFAAILICHRFWKSNPIPLMMLQFGGNLVVMLSSFGVHVHAHSFWWLIDGPVDTLIALNVIFLLLAATMKKTEQLMSV